MQTQEGTSLEEFESLYEPEPLANVFKFSQTPSSVYVRLYELKLFCSNCSVYVSVKTYLPNLQVNQISPNIYND